MYRSEQSTFLYTLQKRPGRFGAGVFLVVLNFISGITTNLHFFTQGLSAFSAYTAAAAPISAASVAGAFLWQLMLGCAVLCAARGGWGILIAAAALCLESFVYGFSMSELLFHYGEESVLVMLLISALFGMAGLMLRVCCFVTADGQEDPVSAAALWKRLFFIALAQGLLLPLMALAD